MTFIPQDLYIHQDQITSSSARQHIHIIGIIYTAVFGFF